MLRIDLNCDMGESWYNEVTGQDESLMPYITSCNLACGVHGGDPETMKRAIELAIQHRVSIGAHPSLPDRANFGREPIDLPEAALETLLFSQLERLSEAANLQDQKLQHLKPHGALYHLAANNEKEAKAIVAAAIAFDIPMIYGAPESLLKTATEAAGLRFIPEGFIDRAYENGWQLRSRKLTGAVHHSSEAAADQAYDLAVNNTITDYYGQKHTLKTETLCLHGDHAEALDHIIAVKARLSALVAFLNPANSQLH